MKKTATKAQKQESRLKQIQDVFGTSKHGNLIIVQWENCYNVALNLNGKIYFLGEAGYLYSSEDEAKYDGYNEFYPMASAEHPEEFFLSECYISEIFCPVSAKIIGSSEPQLTQFTYQLIDVDTDIGDFCRLDGGSGSDALWPATPDELEFETDGGMTNAFDDYLYYYSLKEEKGCFFVWSPLVSNDTEIDRKCCQVAKVLMPEGDCVTFLVHPIYTLNNPVIFLKDGSLAPLFAPRM